MRDSCRRGAARSRARRRRACRCNWRRRCQDGHSPRDAVDAGARFAVERPDARPGGPATARAELCPG
eukprot:11231880-Alexandrium_andersonii.AAC.1